MSDSNRIDSDSIKTNTVSMPEDFEGEMIGAVPIAELEELVEEWNKTLEWAKEHREVCSNEAINVGEMKIDELDKIIEEHKDD